MGGLYAYVVNTRGLVVGQQYDLLFRAAGDPVVHAVTFTEKRPGLLGSLSVRTTTKASPAKASAPKLRTGIWTVPSNRPSSRFLANPHMPTAELDVRAPSS